MDTLEKKITNIKGTLIRRSRIGRDSSVLFKDIYKNINNFANDYLAELEEFEQEPINKKYNVLIFTESVFFRYLAKYNHTMIFDGTYIKFALCDSIRTKFYVGCFCPTNL